MVIWKNEKDTLKYYIDLGISYEEIGRKYGCTGANIKKQAKKLGIVLSQKRKINEKETFNKGVKRKTCIVCGKPISRGLFCSNECHNKHRDSEKTERWLNGENFLRGASQVPNFIRRYLFAKYGNKCQFCGWDKKNEYTNTIPLEIHHIDGDCTNNKIENLQLLCPNCHSLTNTNGSLNKNSKRFHRKKKTLKDED